MGIWGWSWAFAGAPLLDSGAQLQDLEALRDALAEGHPALHAYASPEQLDAVRADIVDRIGERARTPAELLSLLDPYVERIGCGHTWLRPARRDRRRGRGLFPHDLLPLEDRLWIDPRAEEGPLAEILVIDGTPADEILADLRARLPADGRTRQTKDAWLDLRFPELYARRFGAQERFLVALDRGGERVEVELDAVPARKVPRPPEGRSGLERREDGVLLVRLDGFERAPWYRRLISKLDAALAADPAAAVVLDLRHNGGGNAGLMIELYRRFAAGPFDVYADTAVTRRFVDDLFGQRSDLPVELALGLRQGDDGAWHFGEPFADRLLWRDQTPATDAHAGPVVVLIGRGTASSASDLAELFGRDGRGLLVGEETGGGAWLQTSGTFEEVVLPRSKIRLDLPQRAYRFDLPEPAPGQGVRPDVEVAATIDEIARGADPVLACALSLAAEGSAPRDMLGPCGRSSRSEP